MWAFVSSQWQRCKDHFILPLVATFTVPPYSMLLCMTLYTASLSGTILGLLHERRERQQQLQPSQGRGRGREREQLPSLLFCWLMMQLGYGGYCVLEQSSHQGPRKSPWIQRYQNVFGSLWFVRWTAQYFQTKLVRTAPLPATSSTTITVDGKSTITKTQTNVYIFAYHPHGVIGMGANLALATNGCQFTSVFPEIVRRSIVTLNVCFWVPFYRHWMIWLGCCSANKQTIQQRLQVGHESIILIPGGAMEALYAHPQTFHLYLKRRKGFLQLARNINIPNMSECTHQDKNINEKVNDNDNVNGQNSSAIMTSTNDDTHDRLISCSDEVNNVKVHVVPVLGFGENDIFETIYQPPTTTQPISSTDIKIKANANTNTHINSNMDDSAPINTNVVSSSWIAKLQYALYKRFTFSIPIWTHFWPRRCTNGKRNDNGNDVPPLTVVVGKPLTFDDPNVSLDECHSQYIQSLRTLYETHQDEYGYKDVPLIIS